jgi:hypothetical protein
MICGSVSLQLILESSMVGVVFKIIFVEKYFKIIFFYFLKFIFNIHQNFKKLKKV